MTEPATARTVERYYDFIYFWTQATNRFRAFREVGTHPIHRGLADPATGDFHADVVHDLFAAELAGREAPVGLDAGCGYGATLIAMQHRTGGTWHGVTINRKQVEVARRNIAALGLSGSISVDRASYDDPLPRRFDVIVGVESLIHSPDPARTIENLGHALLPGGLIMIVDDMPEEPFPVAHAADLAGFMAGWKCPVAPSAAGWIALLEKAGCRVVANRDLTPLTRPRPEAEIAEAIAEVRRRRRWRDKVGLRLVSDAQEGGLHLERLLAAGAIRYRLLVARKDD